MDEPALRAKIAKLDRLASDRNPNAHERASAKAKADKLRKKLPQEKPVEDVTDRTWARWAEFRPVPPSPAKQTQRRKTEQKVTYLMELLNRVKPSRRVFAADLCAQWFSRGWLSASQLDWVDELIKEAEGI